MVVLKRLFLIFALIVAMGLLGVSSWHQWNDHKKTIVNRLQPIPPNAEFMPGSTVRQISFSSTNPDLFATAGGDNLVKVWNANIQESPQLTFKAQKEDHGATILVGIAFSPTDAWLASKTSSTLEFWDITSGEKLNTLQISSSKFAISPESDILASVYVNLLLWDISDPKNVVGKALLPPNVGWESVPLVGLDDSFTYSGKTILRPRIPSKYQQVTSRQFYNAIDFSHDGKWIAAGGLLNDENCEKGIIGVKVWDLTNQQLFKILKLNREVSDDDQQFNDMIKIRSINFSPDNRYFGVAGEDGLTIWSLPDWKIYHEVLDQYFIDLEFSPDSKIFAIAHIKGITLWSTDSLTPIALLRGKSQYPSISAIAFSHDGTKIVSGSNNGVIHLWDVSEIK